MRSFGVEKFSDQTRSIESPIRDEIFAISTRYDNIYQVSHVILWVAVGSVGAVVARVMESRCKRASSSPTPEAKP